MKRNPVLTKFFAALTSQEAKIAELFKHDNIGQLLKAAISEMDWYRYNFLRIDEMSREQEEHSYILQIGITRLVQLALKMRPSFDFPVITFVRHPSVSLPTLQILGALGMIEHGRRVAQSVLAGIGQIEQIGDNEFRIMLPEKVLDDEHYERAVVAHYSNQSRQFFSEIFKKKVAGKIQGEVEDALHELVYPWKEHFIGYGATPILDEYFFSVAYAELQVHDGFDSFNGEIEFGGIPYQTYLLALTFLVAIFIRHEQFAEALVRKNPTSKLENVLTITSDTPEFLQNLVEALNHFGQPIQGYKRVGLGDAQKIFAVLSVSRDNLALLENPGSAVPLLIQSSEQGFIRCLAGAQLSPVKFLLDSLRHRYPGDYDRNQQTREKSMQIGLARVLDGAIPNLICRENIKIKVDGKLLTDLDAVVIDGKAGIVFLCQLKYQELYGADLHAKRERTTRLKEQVVSWLGALDHWAKSVDDATMRATLGLPKSLGNFSILRVVISRHYAYPLKDVALGDGTTYANWAQFYNAVELAKKDAGDSASLGVVFDKIEEMIKPEQPHEHEVETRTRWTIDDLVFVTQQKGDGDGDSRGATALSALKLA
ncbi:hypothetical protein F2P45_18765 [Massilia sp. CCM 8733]|uniref:NERD domain-containing protein n=1 Tax=Massilia mucilaginosa TaxID=2609282 RepID=A0ABX0NW02_9BURK|nr:hypothetical protein [Massilia mucilaginosa]NHZ91042.1 hypothetical protein [Massilia mucilaginosa]